MLGTLFRQSKRGLKSMESDLNAGPTTKITCANVLRVMADDVRLNVLRQLLNAPKFVNELLATLPISQSLLSHHLRILRDSGLVDTQRCGKNIRYSIAPQWNARFGENGIDLGCCALTFDRDSCEPVTAPETHRTKPA